MRLVTPGYFRAMGVRLRAGRTFTAEDRAGAPLVMVINETMARQAWPGEDPLGKRVACCEPGPDGGPNWKTVVGVVADVRARGLGRDRRRSSISRWRQAPKAAWRWIDRTHDARRADPGEPIGAGARRCATPSGAWTARCRSTTIATMDDRRTASLASARFSTTLLTAFGGIALLLAAIGVYGVISYGVTQRAQEIGIRVALGAGHGRVLRLVVGHAAALTGVGLALGLRGRPRSCRAHRRTALPGESRPTRPRSARASWCSALVALVAALLPARRAARVDPAVALRAE